MIVWRSREELFPKAHAAFVGNVDVKNWRVDQSNMFWLHAVQGHNRMLSNDYPLLNLYNFPWLICKTSGSWQEIWVQVDGKFCVLMGCGFNIRMIGVGEHLQKWSRPFIHFYLLSPAHAHTMFIDYLELIGPSFLPNDSNIARKKS